MKKRKLFLRKNLPARRLRQNLSLHLQGRQKRIRKNNSRERIMTYGS
jgi:hypothetical protein